MARVKQTVTQRDFSRMEVREDFLEADDLELRGQSLQSARNCKALSSRTSEVRPGTFYKRTLSSAQDLIEINPTSELTYGLLLNNSSIEIIDAGANVVETISSVPWTDASAVWVEPFRGRTVIGGAFGLYVLSYDAGTWTFARISFSEGTGGEIAQPYWAYEKSIAIQPSGLTGAVTVTASSGLWTAGYVGLRIRYAQREILITSRVSSTVLQGTVVDELPPTLAITVADASGYKVGEAVIGADSGYQGIVISKAGSVLTVLTLNVFEGPTDSEVLAGANAAATVTSSASATPAATTVWDEPLMSDVRGWPRAGGSIGGRIVLVDFPRLPDLIAASSIRDITDFGVGIEDDDAIVRQVGENSPRWLHALKASDLILFSDKGIYYVEASGGTEITPSNFNPVQFDERGSSTVRPVRVQDGALFVEASGNAVAAALQVGNVYLRWQAQTITTLHDHLINMATKLCGPATKSPDAEKFVFVVNADGTLATISWNQTVETFGFAPWDTEGTFVSVSPVFSGYWAIVDRVTSNGTERFLELFDNSAVMDCAVETSTLSVFSELTTEDGTAIDDGSEAIYISEPAASHIPGKTVAIGTTQWYRYPFTVNADGTIDGEPDIATLRQIGLPFTFEMQPWPVELIQSPRVGMVSARVMRVTVSVQNTSHFDFVANGITKTVGGYDTGADLSSPPALKTKKYTFTVFGNRDHPEFYIRKAMPGALRVLAVTQEVQG